MKIANNPFTTSYALCPDCGIAHDGLNLLNQLPDNFAAPLAHERCPICERKRRNQCITREEKRQSFLFGIFLFCGLVSIAAVGRIMFWVFDMINR
jgi:hypothetical protein